MHAQGSRQTDPDVTTSVTKQPPLLVRHLEDIVYSGEGRGPERLCGSARLEPEDTASEAVVKLRYELPHMEAVSKGLGVEGGGVLRSVFGSHERVPRQAGLRTRPEPPCHRPARAAARLRYLL